MRILHLYRPRLPSLRAQAIQVLHACHALAERGHTVTVLADRGDPPTAAAALASLGLTAPPGLHLRIAPVTHSGLAGLWFRAQLAAWWMGPPGAVIARDKRRLDAALRWLQPRRHTLILESHELDSALAAERGEAPEPIVALEARLLGRVDALVTNCGGTMAAWEAAHGAALPARRRVCHNAVSPHRRRALHPRPDPVIRCVGSLRAYKGVAALGRIAPHLPLPLELVGGSAAEQAAFSPTAGLTLRDAVPYTEVPDLLARSAVLLLPLKDNLFGRQLTSPLKLWDYLATAAPIVAPDLPTIREIAALTGAPLHLHAPDDPAGILAAVRRARAAPPRTPVVRTWAARAAEIEELL